jgi:hypothetical protein
MLLQHLDGSPWRESILTIPKRGSATATRLLDRARANKKRREGEKRQASRGRGTREPHHRSHTKLEQNGVKTWNGNVIITVCRRGGCSMSMWGWDMQTRSGDFVIADQVQSTRGLQQERGYRRDNVFVDALRECSAYLSRILCVSTGAILLHMFPCAISAFLVSSAQKTDPRLFDFTVA